MGLQELGVALKWTVGAPMCQAHQSSPLSWRGVGLLSSPSVGREAMSSFRPFFSSLELLSYPPPPVFSHL